MLTLSEIKSQVDSLASKIDASGFVLPTYGRTEDGARPHIESDSGGYHYVIVERGQELKRLTTLELDVLLAAIFSSVTSSLSYSYELAHRVEGQDCRRIAFQHQIDLLSALSPDWAERESKRHNEILLQHPFDDLSSTRARLCKDYRDQGQSPDVAWAKACEQYPLPVR